MGDSIPTVKEWRQSTSDGDYLISTDNSLLDRAFITTAFGTDDMHWAKPLPRAQLEMLLAHSQNMGLYWLPTSRLHQDGEGEEEEEDSSASPSSPRTPSPTLEGAADAPAPQQIGFARLVTDFVTTAYVTDVYVSPGARGKGLATWMVGCCGALIEAMPGARRAVLMASPGKGAAFYARELGLRDVAEERQRLVMLTKTFFDRDGH